MCFPSTSNIMQQKTLAGENIGRFNCSDYLEEKTLVNGLQIKYRYWICIWGRKFDDWPLIDLPNLPMFSLPMFSTTQYLKWVESAVHRRYLAGANCTDKSYWQGKIWRMRYSQCLCQIHFQCVCEYWQGKFWRITHDSPFFPVKYFPCTV